MSVPKWWDKDRERQNERSRRQERARAQEIGGRVTAGSGSSWRSPQDVRSGEYLEQIKYTDQKSFALKAIELQQVADDADRAGKLPRMVVDFERYGVRAVILIESLDRRGRA